MNKKKKLTPKKATSRNSAKPSLKAASKNTTRSAKPKTKVFGSKVKPQPKKKAQTKKKATGKIEDKTQHVCELEHEYFANFKNESNKDWFLPNNRFFGAVCFKCEIHIGTKARDNIWIPSCAKPVHLCNNSTKECKKCVCNSCFVNMMIDDGKKPKVRSRRRSKT